MLLVLLHTVTQLLKSIVFCMVIMCISENMITVFGGNSTHNTICKCDLSKNFVATGGDPDNPFSCYQVWCDNGSVLVENGNCLRYFGCSFFSTLFW